MGTPDRFPGERVEEELQLEARTSPDVPTVAGALSYVDGAHMFIDATGAYDPHAGLAPEFKHKVKTGLYETTSTTFVVRPGLTMNTDNDMPNGTYIILASAVLVAESASTAIGARGRFDAVTFGKMSAKPGVADGEVQFMAFAIKENISGNHNLNLQIRKEAGSGRAGMRYASIAIWKIAD